MQHATIDIQPQQGTIWIAQAQAGKRVSVDAIFLQNVGKDGKMILVTHDPGDTAVARFERTVLTGDPLDLNGPASITSGEVSAKLGIMVVEGHFTGSIAYSYSD